MYSSDMFVAESVADATMNNEAMMGLFFGIMIFTIVLGLISIISNWKIFNKAGKPGWASIIPIYNYIVMIQIAKLSMIYLLLLIIPIVNVFAIFKINIEIAKKFGKSAGFGIGMTLFAIIFIPLLAFSDNTYEDNKVETSTEENSNNNVNVNVQEIVAQPNSGTETVNIDGNNQVPIMTNEQNTIPEQPLENNISNIEIKKTEEPIIANESVVNTEINSDISTMNEVPVVEPVNIDSVVPNIPETPNAFNSKPIDIVPQSNDTITNNESIVNIEPVINPEIKGDIPTTSEIPPIEQVNVEPIVQKPLENINMGNANNIESMPQINEIPPIEVQTENIQPINNNIEFPEIKPQEINEIPTIKEGTIGEQSKVCKNCGESMPSIVSICPKCGTDNE